MILKTERLYMRRWTLDDHAALHTILSDPTTMQFWPAPLSAAQTQDWLERSLARYAADGYGRWAVLLKATNELIGDCGIVRAEINGVTENDLGYIIHHPYWRQGYATEAARACVHYAFDALGLRRLVANMAVDHVGSQRVAEQVGMQRVATFSNPRNRNLPTYLYVLEA